MQEAHGISKLAVLQQQPAQAPEMFVFIHFRTKTQYFKDAYNLQVFVEMGEIWSHKAMTTSVWNQTFTQVRKPA